MKSPAVRSLVRGIRARKITAIAQAISILENDSLFEKKLSRHLPFLRGSSRGFVVGVTGSAGSGKSTLIAALAKRARRDKKKVGILAVDPSSPKSGGAFLGDRVRMQELAEDSGVFIRSMASRGARGGVARGTRGSAELFRAAGYDLILIETVGAGQLDDEVTKISDVTLLVLTPESGDEMQLMKAGIRELADIFVVNKSDRPGAARMARLLKEREGNKNCQVFQTAAEEGKGVEALYRAVAEVRRVERRGVIHRALCHRAP
jgi:LAO/AO transport system kinase